MSTLLTVFMLMLAGQVGRSSSPAEDSATANPPSAPVLVEETLQEPAVNVARPEAEGRSPPRQVLSEVVDPPRWRRQSWLRAPAVEAQAAVSEQFVVLVEDAHGGVLPGANVRLSRPDPDSQPT